MATAPYDRADTRAGRTADTLRGRIAELVASAALIVHDNTAGNKTPLVLSIVNHALVSRNLAALDADALSDDVRPDVRDVYRAVHALSESIDTLESLGGALDYALHDRPRGLDDMNTVLWLALGEYETAANAVTAAAVAWGDHNLKGPTLKAAVIAALMSPEGGGYSRSAAEKGATAYPTYQAYREELDELARGKHDAETAETIARVRLETLRDIADNMRGERATYVYSPQLTLSVPDEMLDVMRSVIRAADTLRGAVPA